MSFRLAALAVLLVPATAAAQEPALSLQELSDREEIRTLLLEYGRSFDEGRAQDYAALFAPQGEWVAGSIRAKGPDEVLAMVERTLAQIPAIPGKRNFHVMTNMMVDVDGDRATAWSRYTFYLTGPEGAADPVVTGTYDDQLVRVGGQWKFQRRLLTADNGGAGALSLGQRVDRAEAEAAIRRLQVEYSARQDARDFDGYVDLFTEDGVWQNGNIVHHGRDAIKGLLVGLYGETPEDFENLDSYHMVSNPQIDIAADGQHATGRSRHLLLMRDEKGSPVPMLAGVYEDEYVKVDGVWKIKKRVDSPLMPQPQEWMAIIRERNARMKDAD